MKRTIEISTRGTRLTLNRSRLIVERDDQILGSIPFEDIGVLAIDSTGIDVSSGVLRALADSGGALLSCDDRHHPNGMFLPLLANSLHAERIRHQVLASDALCRNIWASIVTAKIKNQAALIHCEATKKRLRRLAAAVRSGDVGNTESQSSRFYWPKVFDGLVGDENTRFLRRRHGPPPNDLLNYGYAVLRAATARAICGAGLHPGLGVHHHNRYGGYCLADDVMEPFRPWVDRCVRTLLQNEIKELGKESKKALLEVLTHPCQISGNTGPLSSALERSTASLAKCFELAASGKRVKPAIEHLLTPRWPESSLKNYD